jgi:hypothetical protein
MENGGGGAWSEGLSDRRGNNQPASAKPGKRCAGVIRVTLKCSVKISTQQAVFNVCCAATTVLFILGENIWHDNHGRARFWTWALPIVIHVRRI